MLCSSEISLCFSILVTRLRFTVTQSFLTLSISGVLIVEYFYQRELKSHSTLVEWEKILLEKICHCSRALDKRLALALFKPTTFWLSTQTFNHYGIPTPICECLVISIHPSVHILYNILQWLITVLESSVWVTPLVCALVVGIFQ